MVDRWQLAAVVLENFQQDSVAVRSIFENALGIGEIYHEPI